jgi:hypothetical protein
VLLRTSVAASAIFALADPKARSHLFAYGPERPVVSQPSGWVRAPLALAAGARRLSGSRGAPAPLIAAWAQEPDEGAKDEINYQSDPAT